MQPNKERPPWRQPLRDPERGAAGFETPGTCFLVRHAIEGDFADALVQYGTARGFQATGATYPPSYRDNDRLVCDDPALAGDLFERLRALLPPVLVDADGRAWHLDGLNARFRFCRYRDGQCFRRHRDGAYADRGLRSRLTLQIYLDDAGGFHGGSTRFYASQAGPLVGRVAPSRGTAVVFDHDLWHDGEPVTLGVKHVMRTDVMYRAPALETGVTRIGHPGYVYGLLPLRNGRLATSSRDTTIRIWRLDDSRPEATVLVGHTASVVALAETPGGTLVSGSRDGTVRAWDLGRRTSRVLMQQDAAVLSIVPLGHVGGVEVVAAGDGVGAIRIVPVTPGGQPRAMTGHRGWVWALATVPGFLLSASEDGTVRLWSTDSGECTGVASPDRGPVHALAAIPGPEGGVAAGFADGHVVVYEADRARGTLSPVQVVAAHDGEIYALAPAGPRAVASGGEDGWARVWRTGVCAPIAAVRHEGFVRAVALTQDGRLASAGYDGVVKLTRAL